MEHKITTSKIIEASKTSKKVKKALEILFPEAFENEKPFCRINDVLVRKNVAAFYQVRECESKAVLVNISSDHVWANKINLPYDKYCGDTNKFLSRQDFKNLVTDRVKSIDEFKVLDLDKLQPIFFEH